MPDEKYKPVAKCRFYKVCAIYNSNILRDEFEIQMCGTGRQPDQRYVPYIPQHNNIKPLNDHDNFPEGPCPAFQGYLYSLFSSDVEELLSDVRRVLKGKPPLLAIDGKPSY